MLVDLIVVPYDSGNRGERMGAGPLRFLDAGLEGTLSGSGHQVRVVPIERQTSFSAEVASAFELNRLLADRARASVSEGRFPLVLSGNCNSAVGLLSALGSSTALAWFDGHGDFNTPDSSASGFLDGMAIPIATGECWPMLTRSIDGFTPVAEQNVILLGARDLDPQERERLEKSAVSWLRPEEMDRLASELPPIASRTRGVLIHVDVDVIDPTVAPTNHYSPADGLTEEELLKAVRQIGAAIPVTGAVIASWDPALDVDGRMLALGTRLIETILESAG